MIILSTLDSLIETLRKRRDVMLSVKQSNVQVMGYIQGVNDCIKDLKDYKVFLKELEQIMNKVKK